MCVLLYSQIHNMHSLFSLLFTCSHQYVVGLMSSLMGFFPCTLATLHSLDRRCYEVTSAFKYVQAPHFTLRCTRMASLIFFSSSHRSAGGILKDVSAVGIISVVKVNLVFCKKYRYFYLFENFR